MEVKIFLFSLSSEEEVTFVIESQAGVHLGRPGRGVGQLQVDDSPPLLGQLGAGLLGGRGFESMVS